MDTNKSQELILPPDEQGNEIPVLYAEEVEENLEKSTNSPIASPRDPIESKCPLNILEEELESDDESLRSVYNEKGAHWDFMHHQKFLTRSNKIWITNRRIIVQEKIGICGLPLIDTVESFQLSDLRNVSMKLDYRLKKLIAFVFFLFFDLEFLMSNRFSFNVIGVLAAVTTVFILLLYVLKLSLRKELMLDFYKPATVNTWLNFTNAILAGRYGSSITKSLCFDEQKMKEIIKQIYKRHPKLITYGGQASEEDGIVPSMPRMGSVQLPPAKTRYLQRGLSSGTMNSDPCSSGGSYTIRPRRLGEQRRRRDSAYILSPHKGDDGNKEPPGGARETDYPESSNSIENQPTEEAITVEQQENVVDELFIEDEICYKVKSGHYNACSSMSDNTNPLAMILREENTIFVMKHRIILKTDVKFFRLVVQSTKEFFRTSDLQNAAISQKSSMWLLLLAVPTTLVGIIVAATAHVGGGVAIILISLAIVVFLSFFLKKTTLMLDFYRMETVHSWLPLFDSAVSWRYGSSMSRGLRLTYDDAVDLVNALYKLSTVKALEFEESRALEN